MELMTATSKKIIDNSELIEAIEAMKKNFNNETQNRVLNTVLHCEFLVPAVLSHKQQIVADAQNKVEFQDQPQATFLFVTNGNGVTYVPAFTDKEQAARFRTEQSFRLFAMHFADLASFTENLEQVQGFLINPDDQALPFTKAILAEIKAELAKHKAKREQSSAEVQ